MDKGWTKNSINRLLVKFRTVDRRLGSGRHSAHILMKTSTQLSRCCWVRKTNLRAKRNFTWGGGSIDRQFRRLFTKFCVSSATRKGALNSWLKRTACTRYFQHAVWETITWQQANVRENWNMQTILEPSEYFCQISAKSIHIISSYTVSKLGRFLRHSV